MTTMNIELSEENNRLLNIIKAMFDLKNKSDALNFIIKEYGKDVVEPQLRPEYVKKMRGIQAEKVTKYNSVSEMRKGFEQ